MKAQHPTERGEAPAVLLLENIHPVAAEGFRAGGAFRVETMAGALSEDELVDKLGGVQLLGIRSRRGLPTGCSPRRRN